MIGYFHLFPQWDELLVQGETVGYPMLSHVIPCYPMLSHESSVLFPTPSSCPAQRRHGHAAGRGDARAAGELHGAGGASRQARTKINQRQSEKVRFLGVVFG